MKKIPLTAIRVENKTVNNENNLVMTIFYEDNLFNDEKKHD